MSAGGNLLDRWQAALEKEREWHEEAERLRHEIFQLISSHIYNQLGSREKQVYGLMVTGLSNKEIGARLYISERTVKFHVSNILRKTGCRRRDQFHNLEGFDWLKKLTIAGLTAGQLRTPTGNA